MNRNHFTASFLIWSFISVSCLIALARSMSSSMMSTIVRMGILAVFLIFEGKHFQFLPLSAILAVGLFTLLSVVRKVSTQFTVDGPLSST